VKSHFSHKFFSLLILSLALSLGAVQVYAQQPSIIYIYDDLGRLVQVVNQNNDCATYEYDAVGNLLRITRSTNCLQPPAIDSLSQDTANAGDTTCITIRGTNFLGATVTSDNPDVQISRVRVSETNIEVCLIISPFASFGTTRIIISTPGGLAQANFTIAPKVAVITQSTVIGPMDRRFDGATLTIEGPVTVTIDGTHRFASLTLRNNAIITHSFATAISTSNLRLTIDGSLTIDSTSRIDVTARGFLGGNQPGNPFGENGTTLGFVRGSTVFGGGSYGGLGGATGGGVVNPVYGDFRDPNDVGSGGSSGSGRLGGNGGGLVRIVAQTLQLDGVIKVDGDNGKPDCCAGGGSGGGIRIDVGTFSGTGQITANGGNRAGSGADGGGGGGGGRVAVYYQDAVGFDFTRVTAFGGVGGAGLPNGGAGTIYLQGPIRESGELIADNNNLSVAALSTPIAPSPSGLLALTNLRVRRAARVRIDDQINLINALEVSIGGELTLARPLIASAVTLSNGGVITQLLTTTTQVFKVGLSASTITVDATSRIDVTARGFLGGNQPGNPFGENGTTVGFVRGSTVFGGGSYGGLGGAAGGGVVNPVYGDFRDPNEVGSGGGSGSGRLGGNGGGLVRIVAQTLQLDGAIKVDGDNGKPDCCAGGGSGGGIRIDVGTLSGTGQITANGGNRAGSGADGGGGGGGGRIAIYFQDAAGFEFSRVGAFGGTGTVNGQDGSVFTQQQTFIIGAGP